jgi:hypothetical protein
VFAQPFHIAILVADLDSSIHHLERALGTAFRPPAQLPFHWRTTAERPEPHSGFSYMSYSLEGPPYYELQQADDSAFKGIAQGQGVHHVGVWVPHAGAHLEAMKRVGISADVEVRSPDGERVLSWFSRPGELNGVRMEFVDSSWRADFDRWMSSREGSPQFYGESEA